MKITETEFRQLLRVHDTDVNVPERPAYRLLQDSAGRYPDRTALIATERTLSYKELNEEANAVGHVLFSKGCGFMKSGCEIFCSGSVDFAADPSTKSLDFCCFILYC